MSGFMNDGAQAEYLCMPETGPITHMPSNLRFDQAVVCEGAFCASPTIEHFALKPGHRILIYGASGAIGTAALQLAKYRGAESEPRRSSSPARGSSCSRFAYHLDRDGAGTGQLHRWCFWLARVHGKRRRIRGEEWA